MIAATAVPGCAGAPETSIRPPVRGGGSASVLVARSGIAQVGYAVADASGNLRDGQDADVPLPPASVAKAITTLYALDRLGSGYRFATRVMATGPVSGGIVQGDLLLVGGGDPTLDTDGLSALVSQLAATGVRGVRGRFVAHGGALPFVPQISDDQPLHVGYNPAISGLNLNYNRVHFGWSGNGAIRMDARGRDVPPVTMSRVQVVARERPVYEYRGGNGVDNWTVAAGALRGGGTRWLPVRHPDEYAAEVFRVLAAARGIALPEPVISRGQAQGTVLVTRTSDPLPTVLSDMLRFSNNLTAEAVGLAASGQGSVASSGRAMSEWARRFAPMDLRDHSGLNGDSRISAAAMVRVLAAARASGLRELMKDEGLYDASGREHLSDRIRIKAKTGTLNFVSGLAGYADAGNEYIFAVFCADLSRRRAAVGEERPAGGAAWTRGARVLQSRLVESWA
ncbi:D-alanyl-D-alanine carboxypeptidase/D-alanyl-D-alanine-endopeptidase [Cereibacter sp. SYSU M97828]|nr:D-alanyl-D-alanine carboxypeptidase/D-alanyl-D-alanine-endopeptidase [Cereibacter flavus]